MCTPNNNILRLLVKRVTRKHVTRFFSFFPILFVVNYFKTKKTLKNKIGEITTFSTLVLVMREKEHKICIKDLYG